MVNRISHDQNFKNLILDYPRDALSFFAPDEAPLPDDQMQNTPIQLEQLQKYPGAHYRELDKTLQVDWIDSHRDTILQDQNSNSPSWFSKSVASRIFFHFEQDFFVAAVLPIHLVFAMVTTIAYSCQWFDDP